MANYTIKSKNNGEIDNPSFKDIALSYSKINR